MSDKVYLFKFFQSQLIEMHGTKVYGGKNGNKFLGIIALESPKRRVIASSIEGKIRNNFVWYEYDEEKAEEIRSKVIETFFKRCYNRLTKLEEDKERTLREIKCLKKVKEELLCQKD